MAFGIVVMLSFAHFLNDGVQSILPAVMPMLKEQHGLSFTEVGIVTLTIQLTSSILQPLVGFCSDKKPKSYALAFGMSFTFIGLILLSRSATLSSILASVALLGAGSAIFHPESVRISQAASGGRKGLAQSVFQLGGNAGASIGPLVAAFVVIPYGQKSIAAFAVLAALAIAILICVGRRAAENAQKAVRKAAATAAPVKRTIFTPRVKFTFGCLFILMFSKQVYISSLQNYLAFFVIEKFGLTTQNAQFVLFAFLAATVAGTLLGGPLSDRLGRRKVILWSILGAAPFALVLPWANLWLAAALSVVVAFIMSSSFAAILVRAIDEAPAHTGAISGVFLGLSFGMGGITAAILGAFADEVGIETVFAVMSGLPLLGLFALALPKEADER